MKEITEQEFNSTVAAETKLAREKLEKMGWPTDRYVDTRWLVSEDEEPPCRYERDYADNYVCPITHKTKPRRKLPKKFNQALKPGVEKLVHAADVMCGQLSTTKTVRCYAKVNLEDRSKYFQCEHKVGNCPHKRR